MCPATVIEGSEDVNAIPNDIEEDDKYLLLVSGELHFHYVMLSHLYTLIPVCFHPFILPFILSFLFMLSFLYTYISLQYKISGYFAPAPTAFSPPIIQCDTTYHRSAYGTRRTRNQSSSKFHRKW